MLDKMSKISAVHPKKSTIYTYAKNIFKWPYWLKSFTVKGFRYKQANCHHPLL